MTLVSHWSLDPSKKWAEQLDQNTVSDILMKARFGKEMMILPTIVQWCDMEPLPLCSPVRSWHLIHNSVISLVIRRPWNTAACKCPILCHSHHVWNSWMCHALIDGRKWCARVSFVYPFPNSQWIVNFRVVNLETPLVPFCGIWMTTNLYMEIESNFSSNNFWGNLLD
jgi:hypothetical protein